MYGLLVSFEGKLIPSDLYFGVFNILQEVFKIGYLNPLFCMPICFFFLVVHCKLADDKNLMTPCILRCTCGGNKAVKVF